jgi:TPR repeat protein
MIDEKNALEIRSQIQDYVITKVVAIDENIISYFAEDMRFGREVLLSEYFPKEIAKRYKKDEHFTVYAHPTQNEDFLEKKQQLFTNYDKLKTLSIATIPTVYQVFESNGTVYIASKNLQYIKTLQQLSHSGVKFSEKQLTFIASELVKTFIALKNIELQINSLSVENLLFNIETNECFLNFVEYVSYQEDGEEYSIKQLGAILHHLMGGDVVDGVLQPLQANQEFSGAFCGVVNQISSENNSKIRTFEKLSTLLQNYTFNTMECEPLVCKEKQNRWFSTIATAASVLLVVSFAYYVFTKPQQVDIKDINWLDSMRYRLVAYFGNTKAQTTLGQLYEKGYGVEQDIDEAIFWYGQASLQGEHWAKVKLADLYSKDSKKYNLAKQYFHELANSGELYAQMRLAQMYEQGFIVEKNVQKALYWYKQAAMQGNKNAKMWLGDYYIKQDSPYEQKKAIAYFEDLAKSGNLYAQQYLGYIYITGKGASKDYTKAMYWFKKAQKEHNDGYSSGYIGFLYWYGYGVKKDLKQARFWFEKGVALGDKYSKKALKSLNKKRK